MRRLVLAALCLAAPAGAVKPSDVPAAALVEPQAFAAALKKAGKDSPLVIHVGFEPLYKLGHIPGSEYLGPGSKPEAVAALRERLKDVPRERAVVLYCGCCPWSHCPNIAPAYRALRALGFKKVTVVRLERNFGQDWAERGLPTVKGR